MNRLHMVAVSCFAAALVVISAPSLTAQGPGTSGGTAPVTIVNPLPLPVDPSGFSHLGRPLSQHVMLKYQFVNGIFNRVLPDATVEEDEFAIPAGQLLVVTDVYWNGNVGPVEDLIGSIQLGKGTGSDFSLMLASSGLSHFGGRITGSDHFTSGAVFSFLPVVRRVNVSSVDTLILRGYVAPQ